MLQCTPVEGQHEAQIDGVAVREEQRLLGSLAWGVVCGHDLGAAPRAQPDDLAAQHLSKAPAAGWQQEDLAVQASLHEAMTHSCMRALTAPGVQ